MTATQMTDRQVEQERILRRIAALWEANPDRTLGQLVESIAYARRGRMDINGKHLSRCGLPVRPERREPERRTGSRDGRAEPQRDRMEKLTRRIP